ncbi:hypothetical protein [Halorubrum yunnanense]|uniref:Uncharacterized protein n=1 Tax=Halorubrum yunnanense TaxID=1526162 RepID=A0ABD5YGN8_9EURY|nr:hypothetical protein [Halorubrum yunnanense]
MARHDAEVELEIRTWAFRERELPRVPPEGWATTTDRLRETVCLAIESSGDAIGRVEPFEGPARERERFEATVTVDDHDGGHPGEDTGSDDDLGDIADRVDLGGFADEYVRLTRSPSVGDSSEAGTDSTERSGDDFEERTEQFDLDEALDRL